MKLIEQILNELGADTLKSITLVPNVCCYLKSVKAVISFSPQCIVLKVGKKMVKLEGEEMIVGEYFEGDILIKGDVRSLIIE